MALCIPVTCAPSAEAQAWCEHAFTNSRRTKNTVKCHTRHHNSPPAGAHDQQGTNGCWRRNDLSALPGNQCTSVPCCSPHTVSVFSNFIKTILQCLVLYPKSSSQKIMWAINLALLSTCIRGIHARQLLTKHVPIQFNWIIIKSWRLHSVYTVNKCAS